MNSLRSYARAKKGKGSGVARPRPITLEERVKIIHLYRDKMLTCKEIGTMLKRGLERVRQVVTEAGILRAPMHKKKPPIMGQELENIRLARKRGDSITKIAKDFGLGKVRLRRALKELGE